MLKLWGEVRGVMGGDGEKCGVAVLGIWGSRKWVAGERGAPSEIRSVHGCVAPDGVRCDPRSPQAPNVIRGACGHMAFGGAARDLCRPWLRGACRRPARFTLPVDAWHPECPARFAAAEICPVVASCLNGILLPN